MSPNWFAKMVRMAAANCAVLIIGLATAGAQPTTNPVAMKPTEVTESCVNGGCHSAIVNRKVAHGPVAQQKCMACHKYEEPREHKFKLVSEQGQLCRDCHNLKERTTIHTPVKQGTCTGCHDPHGSDFRKMLVADPAQGLCLKCHKQNFAAKKFVHGPVATGACILCHEPHSSWQPKLLIATPDKLCTGCHSEMVPKGNQGRHVHAPVKDGNCTGCHDAHASDAKYQLREAAPGLCLSCHKEMGKALAASSVTHGAIKDGTSCSGCHAPHFSELPKLQRASQPQSCLTCHDKSIKATDGATIADIASLLKNNPDHHGPIREGACTACHQPHAGEHFRLLGSEYPPEFYAPFDIERYALCFKCHIPDMVLKPEGKGLTQFRNGDVNLHWLHVNRDKGRTCRACHEVHASKNPFHIRDQVPFGAKGWMLEIGFKQTPTGGTCAPGCHKPQEYNHGEIKRPTTAPTTQKGIHDLLPTNTIPAAR